MLRPAPAPGLPWERLGGLLAWPSGCGGGQRWRRGHRVVCLRSDTRLRARRPDLGQSGQRRGVERSRRSPVTRAPTRPAPTMRDNQRRAWTPPLVGWEPTAATTRSTRTLIHQRGTRPINPHRVRPAPTTTSLASALRDSAPVADVVWLPAGTAPAAAPAGPSASWPREADGRAHLAGAGDRRQPLSRCGAVGRGADVAVARGRLATGGRHGRRAGRVGDRHGDADERRLVDGGRV